MDIQNILITLGILLGVTLVIGFVIWGVFPYLAKRGVNMKKTFNIADTLVDGVSTMVDVTEAVIPTSPIVDVLRIIEKWAKIGVDSAEQLYITSQLEKDERKAVAVNQVHSVLQLLGVEVTPEMNTIIEGAIEAQVMALGHKENK